MEPIELFKAVAEYGFMTVFASLTLYFAYRHFNLKIGHHKKCVIRNHPVFSEINYCLTYLVPRAEFGTKGRTLLFSRMITLQLESIRSAAEDLSRRSHDDIECFIAENTAVFLDMVKRYESSWDACGVPREAKKAFNRWHGPKMKLLPQAIESIARSSIYDTFDERQWAVFDYYRFLINMTVVDSESSLSQLNGTISGRIFQGETI